MSCWVSIRVPPKTTNAPRCSAPIHPHRIRRTAKSLFTLRRKRTRPPVYRRRSSRVPCRPKRQECPKRRKRPCRRVHPPRSRPPRSQRKFRPRRSDSLRCRCRLHLHRVSRRPLRPFLRSRGVRVPPSTSSLPMKWKSVSRRSLPRCHARRCPTSALRPSSFQTKARTRSSCLRSPRSLHRLRPPACAASIRPLPAIRTIR